MPKLNLRMYYNRLTELDRISGPGSPLSRRIRHAFPYPTGPYRSWVITRKLSVTDSAMASRSRGRVSLKNLKIASVNWRKSAWNRLRGA